MLEVIKEFMRQALRFRALQSSGGSKALWASIICAGDIGSASCKEVALV